VAIELASIARRIRGASDVVGNIALTGGGSRSDAWAQIAADAFGHPVARIREPNPGLRGGAIYALSALVAGSSPRAMAASLSPDGDVFEPSQAATGLYAASSALTDRLRSTFSGAGLDAAIAEHIALAEAHGPRG
jgi:sugar (pentulose or hexulose) kinase